MNKKKLVILYYIWKRMRQEGIIPTEPRFQVVVMFISLIGFSMGYEFKSDGGIYSAELSSDFAILRDVIDAGETDKLESNASKNVEDRVAVAIRLARAIWINDDDVLEPKKRHLNSEVRETIAAEVVDEFLGPVFKKSPGDKVMNTRNELIRLFSRYDDRIKEEEV